MENTCDQNKHKIYILDILLNTPKSSSREGCYEFNRASKNFSIRQICVFGKWQSGQNPVDIHARHILVVSTYPGVFFSYPVWSLNIPVVSSYPGGWERRRWSVVDNIFPARFLKPLLIWMFLMWAESMNN